MRGTHGYFWGIFLIGIGVLMIIKHQFKLNISMPKIVIGILFLALGISMLIGESPVRTKSHTIFSESKILVVEPEKEYNVIFGNTVIDLSNIKIDEGVRTIEINTVFGNSLVKIDPEIPTRIELNSAFANGNTPDGSAIVLGDHTCTIGEGEPELLIKANVVFGKIDFEEK